MVVSYKLKHFEMDDERKDYLEKRLRKFKFYYEQIININVIVNSERGRIITEVKVKANGDLYFAKEKAQTWQESFDDVTDKIEKEIIRKKEKMVNHHKQ